MMHTKTGDDLFDEPMTVREQVEIMESQLSNFGSLVKKMQYMNQYFDNDPTFSKEARDIVRSNIAKRLPKPSQ